MKKIFFVLLILTCSFTGFAEARRHCDRCCRGGCGGGVVVVNRYYGGYGAPYQAFQPNPYWGPGPYWGSPYWGSPYGDPYCDPYYPRAGGGFYFQMNFR